MYLSKTVYTINDKLYKAYQKPQASDKFAMEFQMIRLVFRLGSRVHHVTCWTCHMAKVLLTKILYKWRGENTNTEFLSRIDHLHTVNTTEKGISSLNNLWVPYGNPTCNILIASDSDALTIWATQTVWVYTATGSIPVWDSEVILSLTHSTSLTNTYQVHLFFFTRNRRWRRRDIFSRMQRKHYSLIQCNTITEQPSTAKHIKK